MKRSKISTEEFIRRAKAIHGDKYDYSKVVYVNNHTKVLLKCNVCSKEFWQTPQKHLIGQGCPYCANNQKMTFEKFVEKANKIHNNKFVYIKDSFTDYNSKMKIICPIHGEFEQSPHNHLSGRGCIKCRNEKFKKDYAKTFEDFVKEANLVHGEGRYSYDDFQYNGKEVKSVIKCNKCGFIFQQTPHNHLQGHGCPHCNISRIESETEAKLKYKQINFIPQFPIGKQYCDFYLPKYNVIIECQGEQHLEPRFIRKGRETDFDFQYQLERDICKYNICQEKGIKLLYYIPQKIFNESIFIDSKFGGIYQKENVYTSIDELINFIIQKDK